MAKKKTLNRGISISQLEGWSWTSEIPTEEDDSYVVYNFYLLHNKPLNDYTADDIHFMIGQDTGLEYLVPTALELIDENITLEASYYPFDMLRQLMRIEIEYWKKNIDQYNKLNQIIDKNSELLNDHNRMKEYVHHPLRKEIKAEIEEFKKQL